MKRRFKLVLAILGGLGGAALAACVVMYTVNSRVDRDDCTSVCSTFAEAMMDNAGSRAKSLSSPELQGRIDTWVAQHAVFDVDHCLSWPRADIDEWGGYMGCDLEQTPTVLCDYQFYCPLESGHRRYSFSVHDVTLRRTEQGYVVVDWGEIKESGN